MGVAHQSRQSAARSGAKKSTKKSNGAKSTRLDDEQLETLLEVVFMVCFANDDFSEAEQARFRERVAQLEDGRLHSQRVDGLMLQAAMRLEKEGRDARLTHARAVLSDPEARHIALALAIDIALADGIDAKERASVHAVAEALDISADELDAMLER